jgi:hypothetical protein
MKHLAPNIYMYGPRLRNIARSKHIWPMFKKGNLILAICILSLFIISNVHHIHGRGTITDRKIKRSQNESTIGTQDSHLITPTHQCLAWVSFADSRYSRTLARISAEATTLGIFNYTFAFSESDLDLTFLSQHANFITQNARGYGFWIWKPYVIDLALSRIPSDCFLIYTDAGCKISQDGAYRALEYATLLHSTAKYVLAFQTPHLEATWTKGDVFEYFNTTPQKEGNIPHVMATVAIFRKSPQATSLVRKWRKIVENNYQLINDAPSVTLSDPSFIDNRHDQSVFSMLIKSANDVVLTLPDETWGSDWDSFNSSIPFQARRIKY